MKTTLPAGTLDALDAPLRAEESDQAGRFPGEGTARQPVHVVYGGAHLFRADTASKLGSLALRSLEEHAPGPDELARVLGLEGHGEAFARTLHARVAGKLSGQAVEDYRIDFEDGYGFRLPEEEDGHALAAAAEVARGMEAGTLPPFLGIRVRGLGAGTRARALRTLDLFLTALVERTDGALPAGFVVTVPKVESPAQVALLAEVLERLEEGLGLAAGALPFEVMVETPRAVLSPEGRAALPALHAAGRGRMRGAHFGAYDYTAALGITAADQALHHPACGFARRVVQVALAGTGVWLSDGATTVLPVPPHRAAAGEPLPEDRQRENRQAVHHAWRLHHDDVRRSLSEGWYQGWDLHPAQLVTRYAAVHGFFLEGMDAAATRLRNFVEQAARATRVGVAFDDAATGQGLLNFFARAVACGALSPEEAAERTTLIPQELRGKSFGEIVEGRRNPQC
jgi:citrate lyase beta subunit